MVYVAMHKRKVFGSQIHETLASKRKSAKDAEKKLHQIDSSLSQIRKELEKEKVESEYLVPEVMNWIETDSVK